MPATYTLGNWGKRGLLDNDVDNSYVKRKDESTKQSHGSHTEVFFLWLYWCGFDMLACYNQIGYRNPVSDGLRLMMPPRISSIVSEDSRVETYGLENGLLIKLIYAHIRDKISFHSSATSNHGYY